MFPAWLYVRCISVDPREIVRLEIRCQGGSSPIVSRIFQTLIILSALFVCAPVY